MQGAARFAARFGRVANGDEGLWLPVGRQIERVAHHVGREEGGAHPTRAEAQRMGREQ